MNPSERIDQLIAGLTDWRGKHARKILALQKWRDARKQVQTFSSTHTIYFYTQYSSTVVRL